MYDDCSILQINVLLKRANSNALMTDAYYDAQIVNVHLPGKPLGIPGRPG